MKRRMYSVVLVVSLLGALATTWLVRPGGIAHANGALLLPPQTCAAQPQSVRCDRQDPVHQQCVADAITVGGEVDAVDPASQMVVGYVGLRYSATCDSYWVRAVGYGGTAVTELIAETRLAPDPALPGRENFVSVVSSTRARDGSLSVYTDMAYHTPPPHGDSDAQFFVTDDPASANFLVTLP